MLTKLRLLSKMPSPQPLDPSNVQEPAAKSSTVDRSQPWKAHWVPKDTVVGFAYLGGKEGRDGYDEVTMVGS